MAGKKTSRKALSPTHGEASMSPEPSVRLLDDVRAILRQARHQAYAAANAVMVEAYWRIGQRIVEEEQGGKNRADYGAFLIRGLSRQLGEEFGRGLSVANLWNFRQFYLTFPSEERLYALRRELTWTHWRLLMRVDDPKERDYYIGECADQGWTTRQLERNMASGTYRRLLVRPAAGEHQSAQRPASQPAAFIKDPYVLEFLGLPEPPSHERPLEDAIVLRLRDFIMELGRGFSFIGRQFRVSTETTHFYVDLVFYNYLLKCFVLIDLKTRKLIHQDIGQMDMYVRLFDDLKRGQDDNPTLGIVLCADKDETMVRYSVLSESRQIFASKYRLVLPSEEELREELDRRHILNLPEANGGEHAANEHTQTEPASTDRSQVRRSERKRACRRRKENGCDGA